MLVSILVGTLCGLLSGFFVAYTGVQPMVVTLGGSFLYSGLALAVVNMSSSEAYEGISGFPESFMKLSSGNIAGMPNQLVIFIALVVIAYILLHKTKYGRYIFLCGVNSSACRYSGIRVRPVIMSTYGLSGMSAALAACVIGILKFGLNMAGMASQYLDIPVGILLIIVLAFRMTGSGNKKLLARIRKNRGK